MAKIKTDRDGRNELHEAVIEKNFEKVRGLLLGGSDVAAKDKAGWTPLHFATQRNLVEIAALLVKNQAPVDSQDENGNTPLSNAVYESRGKGEMIALLRLAGANPNKKNNHGVSPLALARSIGNYDVAKFFEDLP